MGVRPQLPKKKVITAYPKERNMTIRLESVWSAFNTHEMVNRVQEVDPLSYKWTCEYCETLNDKNRCTECGAPEKEK